MKKITLILIFFSLIFASELQYDECKTDIYFINGVWNIKREALSSVDKLTKILFILIFKTMFTIKLTKKSNYYIIGIPALILTY